jgi:prepilin-type N-terminal cleavage/methylation domain-containing protein
MRRLTRKFAFTLVELLVVIAIIGILVALLRRSQCQNNLKQLSLAHLNFETAKRGLVPMAKFWTDAEYRGAYPPGTDTPGGWRDDHGWYIPLMPYIEEAHLKDAGNPDLPLSNAANEEVRKTFIPLFACPSDIGLQRNEWGINIWARIRFNYVVNAGNTTYGQHSVGGCPLAPFPTCREFHGAPFIPRKPNRLAKITDGQSNTLMMSEGLVLPDFGANGWGGPYSDGQTALGGQVFTGFNTPNSSEPDALCRQGEWWNNVRVIWMEQGLPVAASGQPSPPVSTPRGTPPDATVDSNGHKQQYLTVRSKHPGGVNASRCDGSIGFIADDVSLLVWDELCSAASGNPLGSL